MNDWTWLLAVTIVATFVWIVTLTGWFLAPVTTAEDGPGSLALVTVTGLLRMFGQGAPLSALLAVAVIVVCFGLGPALSLAFGLGCAFVTYVIHTLCFRGSWMAAWAGEVATVLWVLTIQTA